MFGYFYFSLFFCVELYFIIGLELGVFEDILLIIFWVVENEYMVKTVKMLKSIENRLAKKRVFFSKNVVIVRIVFVNREWAKLLVLIFFFLL